MASSEDHQSFEGDSRQKEEGPSPSQDRGPTQVMQHVFANDKLGKILRFLLHRYQKKERITKEDMLHILMMITMITSL